MNPFCNMCFKAGKSEKEYKSHWLRDRPGPGGVVVCPYLLSIECRYCHEKGHTVSRCPVLANKKRMQHNNNQYCVPVPLASLPPLPPPPPLVMPVKINTQNRNVPEKEKQHEDKAQVEDKVQLEDKAKILGKRKIFTPKMSWADMCDSDVEDDEF